MKDDVITTMAVVLAGVSLWLGFQNRARSDEIQTKLDEVDKYSVRLDEEITGAYECARLVAIGDAYTPELYYQCLNDWSEQNVR